MQRLQAYLAGRSVEAAVGRLRLHIYLPFLAILVCIGAIFALVYWSALALDRYALLETRSQLQYQADAVKRESGRILLEYSWWNEAIEQTIYARSKAWSDENLGVYLSDRYHLSAMVALGPHGEAAYRYASPDTRLPDGWAKDNAIIGHLVDEALAGDPESPTPASSFAEIRGSLYVLAAAPFAAYEPSGRDLDRFHGVLVAARPISERELAAWGEQYSVEAITVEPADEKRPDSPEHADVHLENVLGEAVPRIAWSPERPGLTFLGQVLPWSVGLVAVVGGASLWLLYKLGLLIATTRNYMTELDQSHALFEQQATVDPVSGLYNRNYMDGRLREEGAKAARGASSLIFLFIDLDRFKMINDTMGHATGDELLQECGRRIQSCLRASDVVCRFGGDEFCVLVPQAGDRDKEQLVASADAIVHKLLAALEAPYDLDEEHYRLDASAGVVLCPQHASSPEDILRFADLAMYQAKADGGSSYRIYGESLLDHAQYHATLRSELRKAVAEGDFTLHYQPVFDLEAAEPVGFEALLRWHSPTMGWVSPGDFIPVAEEADLIVDLGQWILERAIRDIGSFNEHRDTPAFVSVNVSVKELADGGYSEYLRGLLEAYALPPELLYLEVTESHELDRALADGRLLRELRELGVQIALDDFGTGYSSFSYLQHLPFGVLKIDRRFVHALADSGSGQDVVQAMLYMADCLGMGVVAEGVETAEQEAILRRVGCRLTQGFHRGRPAPLRSYLPGDDEGTSGEPGRDPGAG